MLDNGYRHVETCNGDEIAIPSHIHDMHYVLYVVHALLRRGNRKHIYGSRYSETNCCRIDRSTFSAQACWSMQQELAQLRVT
jgi:hypothetical protein